MKNINAKIFFIGLIIAVILSNAVSVVRAGKRLEHIRSSVLRLHILADSDSEQDQKLKLAVRDELLESGIFSAASDLREAEILAAENLGEIEKISENVLRKHGCNDNVRAFLTEMDFDERVYGDITMPAGNYHALRVEIGSAKGHNWWCVMYPPLCLPAACEVEDDKEQEEEFFTQKELDILNNPQKYQVRFAVWDKIKEIKEMIVVKNDENKSVA